MQSDAITRAEHEEFAKRLTEQNERQDKRLALLEEDVRQMRQLNSNVERLAVSMEGMLKEQEKQGQRLSALEGRDGEKWRHVMLYVITALISAGVGYLFSLI